MSLETVLQVVPSSVDTDESKLSLLMKQYTVSWQATKDAVVLRTGSSPFRRPLSPYMSLWRMASTVTFPATEHHCSMTGTNLYCLVTEAHVFECARLIG